MNLYNPARCLNWELFVLHTLNKTQRVEDIEFANMGAWVLTAILRPQTQSWLGRAHRCMGRAQIKAQNGEARLPAPAYLSWLCIFFFKKKNLIVLWKTALFIINEISFHSILWCPQQDYKNNNLISNSFQFQRGYFVELEINDQKKTSQN